MRRVTIGVAAAVMAFWAAVPEAAWPGKPQRAGTISLQIERTIAAPPSTVFGLWTDPQAVARWFLPPDQAYWTEPPRVAARRGANSACG